MVFESGLKELYIGGRIVGVLKSARIVFIVLQTWVNSIEIPWAKAGLEKSHGVKY